jgi:hypothetical protein
VYFPFFPAQKYFELQARFLRLPSMRRLTRSVISTFYVWSLPSNVDMDGWLRHVIRTVYNSLLRLFNAVIYNYVWSIWLTLIYGAVRTCSKQDGDDSIIFEKQLLERKGDDSSLTHVILSLVNAKLYLYLTSSFHRLQI